MAWEDLGREIEEEFSALEGQHDLADGLTLSRRGLSASDVVAQAAIRDAKRLAIWHTKLERGAIPGRCSEDGCHNLLAPSRARPLPSHCSEACRDGVERRKVAALAREEQRARLIRAWDEAGKRLWKRARPA